MSIDAKLSRAASQHVVENWIFLFLLQTNATTPEAMTITST